MPITPESDPRQCALTAELADAVVGVARIVTDGAKFGLSLTELHLVRQAEGGTKLNVRISAPGGTNIENVAARRARRVSIVSLSLT